MSITNVDISRYAPRFEVLVNGVPISAEATHAISDIEVSRELNRANSFNFTVEDEFSHLGFKWLGQDVFKIGNPVAVALGYSTLMLPMVTGKINELSTQFVSGLRPAFSVSGMDDGYTFLRTPSAAKDFRDKTDSDIVREIAGMAKMMPVVDRTDTTYPVKTKIANRSYFDFLQGLAEENGYKFFLAGRRLHFTRPEVGGQPGVNLNWGRDLISFRPRMNTAEVLTEVRVRSWDQIRGESIEGSARAGDEQRQESGRQLASQHKRDTHGDAVEVITDRPVRSTEEANRIARSRLEEASDSFITGTAEIIGMPELEPGMCLYLGGLGEWFSGKYFIDKVTHRIDGSGYRSTIHVRRNAL